MKYLKLFLPLPIAILLTALMPLFENYSNNYTLVLGIIIKGGLLIYYLRLQNNCTPMVNTLTIILLFMLTGEFLFNNNIFAGRIIFILASLTFIIVFFIRQKTKDKKDKTSSLKTASVAIYGVGNIVYVNGVLDMLPLIIGTLFLTSVYFYDRLMELDDGKNYRQQKL